jgi:hypothetical protein
MGNIDFDTLGVGDPEQPEQSLEAKLLIPQILTLPRIDDGLKYGMCLEAMFHMLQNVDVNHMRREDLEQELSLLAMAQQHRWKDFKHDIYYGLELPDDMTKGIVKGKDFDAWSSAVVDAYLEQAGYFGDSRPEYDHSNGTGTMKKVIAGLSVALTVGVVALGTLLYDRPDVLDRISAYLPSPASPPAVVEQELAPTTVAEPEPVEEPMPVAMPSPSESYAPIGRVIRKRDMPDGEEGCSVTVRRPGGIYTEGEIGSSELCSTIETGMLAYRNEPGDGRVGFCQSSEQGRCDE